MPIGNEDKLPELLELHCPKKLGFSRATSSTLAKKEVAFKIFNSSTEGVFIAIEKHSECHVTIFINIPIATRLRMIGQFKLP